MRGRGWIARLVTVGLASVVAAGAAPALAREPASPGLVRAPDGAEGLAVPPRIGRADALNRSGLLAWADSSWSAVVSWASVQGADHYDILRDGRLLDVIPGAGPVTWSDALLWQTSTYAYEVKAVGADGTVLSDVTTSVTTPAQVGSFPRFYSDTSFWNTPIPRGPAIDPGSAAMVSTSLTAYKNLGVINSGDDWGIPLAYADGSSETYTVACLLYGCNTTVTFRIPRYATPNTGWDGHLAVYDPTTDQELDLWQGAYDPATDTWSASGRAATASDWGAACAQGTRCGGGGTAAGFLEFGGVIRPEEIAQGHIDHALVLSSPYVRADYIACPATNYWASLGPEYHQDPKAIPLGARIQLDPTINVNAKAWPTWEKIVAKALQTYGAYVADVSGSLELRGEANLDRGYDAWAKIGMTTMPKPDLSNLPWKRFRVLSMTSC